MPDPQASLRDIIFGRWQSQILYTGVKLGIFDALADAPQAAPAIAEHLRLDPALCYRLLRALGSLDLLQEDSHRRFALTAAGDLLRQDHAQTLRGVTLLEEGSRALRLMEAPAGDDSRRQAECVHPGVRADGV